MMTFRMFITTGICLRSRMRIDTKQIRPARICDADTEVLPRSKSNCSGALFYYLSAQIKQNSVFYANFQKRIINRFFGQAFSRKKSLRVEGGALVALRRERNPHTSCAPQGVNSKTVRWTVLEEGTPCKRGRAPQKHNVKILLY